MTEAECRYVQRLEERVDYLERKMKSNPFEGLTDEDLQTELERRRKELDRPPTPLEKPDFSALIHCTVTGVERAVAFQREDEDLKQYIYEEALKAIYGPGFFAWRNKQCW